MPRSWFFEGWILILQARLQHYLNPELPDLQIGFRKGRGKRGEIANICSIIEKAREFQKTSTSILLTVLKPLTVRIITNCRKLLKRWGYQTTLLFSRETCLWVKKQQLELYMEQLVQDWERSTDKTIYCHPDYLYAEHIMWNARLNKLQARIKIFRRNINNHSFADIPIQWHKRKRK